MKLSLILIFGLIACNSNPNCTTPTFSMNMPHKKPSNISAKRAVPNAVTPVVVGKVRFSAPYSLMGHIVADDIETGNKLWDKQIYQVKYKEQLERDVQDVFIDSIVVKCDYLYIHNELDQTFKMSLIDFNVTKL